MADLVLHIQIGGHGKQNLHVDQLLQLKSTANTLFYPTRPTYEERIENSNEEEARKRIRNRGPMTDRYTWDEADRKVKSLIYLSPGTEATRIFQERNPHTLIDHCSTIELGYELGLTFTRPRNLTLDRFQLITVQQNGNTNL